MESFEELMEPLREGSFERLQALLRGGRDINERDGDGTTLLWWASGFYGAERSAALLPNSA